MTIMIKNKNKEAKTKGDIIKIFLLKIISYNTIENTERERVRLKECGCNYFGMVNILPI